MKRPLVVDRTLRKAYALFLRLCGYLIDTFGELQPSVYVPYAKCAVEVVERERGKESVEAASTYNNLGGVCLKMGKHKEEKKYYELALKIYKATLGEEHSGMARTSNNLGNVCSVMGKHKEAKKSYERAMKIRKATLPVNHTSIADSKISPAVSSQGMWEKGGRKWPPGPTRRHCQSRRCSSADNRGMAPVWTVHWIVLDGQMDPR
jgi:tetratricopeptide (TPR) repeat protein